MKADQMFLLLHTFVSTPVQILLLCSHFVVETVTTTQTETCISVVDGQNVTVVLVAVWSASHGCDSRPSHVDLLWYSHVNNHIMLIMPTIIIIMNTSLGVSGDWLVFTMTTEQIALW